MKKERKKRKGKGFALPLWPVGVVIGLAGFLVLFAAGSVAYALNLENHDAFCASCHTEPESRYFQQAQDTNTPTLASFHAQKDVRCIDCHSGAGSLGRLTGLSQGSRDLIAYYSGHYHNPAITTNKLGDTSCTKCHPDTEANAGFDNHFHRFLPRWQSADPQAAHCIDCHTSHSITNAAQGSLDVPTVQTVCERCHATMGEE